MKVLSTAAKSAFKSAAAAKGAHPNPYRRHAWPSEMGSTHPAGGGGGAGARGTEGAGESLVQSPRI